MAIKMKTEELAIAASEASEMSALEREIRALRSVGVALEALSADARRRVLTWAMDRWRISDVTVTR